MKILLSTFICLIFVIPHLAERVLATQRDFVMKVGVIKRTTATRGKLWETNKLPMDPTKRPGFCFIIDPPNKKPYEVYSISYLPKNPKKLTGEFQDMKLSRAVDGIKTKTKLLVGIRQFCFDFHQGDPIGKYVMEVFINNTLKTTLNLDVVPPKPNPQNDKPLIPQS